jgi:hypothetical protein
VSLFADLVSESSGSGAGIFDDLLPPPADDGSFDRAEATRFASQSVAREDAAAARPAFRYAGSGRDVAPAQPARPAGAGVMWDGKTDQDRRNSRVQQVGFAQASRESRARAEAAPSGTITPIERNGLDQVGDTSRRGAQRAWQGFDALGAIVGTLPADAAGRRIAERQRRIEADAPPEDIQAGIEKITQAKTLGEAAGALARNPRATLTLLGESVIASTPALATTIAGSIVGPGGTAAGAAIGSFASEYGASVVDYLTDKGLDPRDPVAITRMLTDPNLRAEAKEYAAKRGVSVAAFDAVSAGLAGRFIGPVLRDIDSGVTQGAVRRVLGASAAEVALQAGAGVAGEGAAQASTGKYKPADLLLEGLAEVPSSIVEAGANVRSTMRQGASLSPSPQMAPASPAAPPLAERLDAAMQSEQRQRAADDAALMSAEKPADVVAAAAAALSRPNLAAQVIERAQQDIARAAQMDRSVELLGLPTRDEAGLRRQLERTNSEAVRIAISAELERRAALAQDRVLIPVTSDADLLARVPVEDPDQTASTVDDLDERSRPTADMPATSSFPVTRLADGSVVKANGRPWSDRGRALQAARALREDVEVVPFDQGDLRGYALRPREASDAGATAPRGTVGGAGQGSATVDDAAHEAAASPRNDLTPPTAAQALAGNYSKGHTRLGGLEVAIENPEGSVREDKKNTPPRWRVRMRAHYGYLKGTRDNTGEPVDTYIRPGTPTDYAGPVFVVDQIDERTGKFDEPKVLVGYTSQREAEAAYDAHHDDGNGPQRRGAVTPMSWQDFRGWVTSDGPQRPVAYREPSAQQAEVRAAARASEVSGTSQQAAPTPAAPPVSQGQPQRAESSDLILDQGDRPFASRARAQLAADRLGRGYRAVRVDAAEGRGWAVQPPPPREVRARRRVPGQSVKNPVLRAIAQAGGISTRYFREVTGEPYSPQTAMRLGLVEVFRRDGRGIDQITDEVLAGRFLTAAQLDDESDVGGVSAALDILADAIQRRADPTYRPPLPLGADESEFERLRDRAYRDAGSGQSAPDAELEAERAAIMAEANALADQLTDDDVRAFMDPGARLSADTLLALGFTDAEAEALQADTDSDAASGSRTQAGSDAIGAAREGRGGTRAPQEAGPRVDRAEQPPDEYAPDDRAQRGGDRGRSARADRDLERRQEDGLPAAGRSDAADRAPGLLQRQRTFRPLEGDGRPRLVAKAIADEFEQAGVLALVGREASAPEDIAALAQVYRDPRYETLRVFYTAATRSSTRPR